MDIPSLYKRSWTAKLQYLVFQNDIHFGIRSISAFFGVKSVKSSYLMKYLFHRKYKNGGDLEYRKIFLFSVQGSIGGIIWVICWTEKSARCITTSYVGPSCSVVAMWASYWGRSGTSSLISFTQSRTIIWLKVPFHFCNYHTNNN